LIVELGVPVVEVLLATYNGEEYLPEFLESLSRQQGVSIILRVSDDGSRDSTLDLINFYSTRFKKCSITRGPGTGPSDNFFSLISQANSDYIALADQDDIWEPTHLINSVKRIEELASVPAMTFTSVSEFTSKPENPLSIWPNKVMIERPLNFFVENLARGCTIVFNRKALCLINSHKPAFAIMHDWWIGLLISLIGEVRYSQCPEVNYRLHQNNYIGSKPSLKSRLQRFNNSREEVWPPALQLLEIYEAFGNQIVGKKMKNVESITTGLTSLKFSKRMHVILTSHRLRSSLFDEVWLRLLLMSRPYSSDSFLWFLYRRTRALARKIIDFITHGIPGAIKDLATITLQRKHVLYTVHKDSLISSNPGKIALVALYPRGPLLSSVKRLVSDLLERDYQVVAVVNNSNLQSWIPQLISLPITIIERPNIGRDFGAYQSGISYLKENGYLDEADLLLICNDSVFYGNNFGNFLKEFDSSKSPWTTAFLNFEKHTHAQSFFQSFTSEILLDPGFQGFWRDYFPSNSRVHAIDKGEVKLSQILLSTGFFPKSIVTAGAIANSYSNNKITFEDFYSVLLETYYPIQDTPREMREEFFWHSLQRSFMEKNCSHLAGLLAFKALNAPLKLDLLATGRVTLESIINALSENGIEDSELNQLIQEFTTIRARLLS
jgi:glycosyltransferase involved in cell wall biosynthesis